MLRVLHTIASLHPVFGGPSRSVVALTDALGRNTECQISLWSQGTADEPAVESAGTHVDRHLAIGQSRLALALGLPLRRTLMRQYRRKPGSLLVDLVHSHGLWHPVNHWSARAARAWGVPLILHPRGMLEPWALEQKAWKKRLGLALFQWHDLKTAAALVATAEMEYLNLRRLGLLQPVAVIPNGVTLPAVKLVGPRIEICKVGPEGQATPAVQHPGRGGKRGAERLALFLSRVHPKKGVLDLVRAWGQVAPAGWRLQIAGPDEGGHWSEVERLVGQLGLMSVVEYLGPVEGEHKAALYRRADLFVLPTFSENFGLVVAEALAYGVPVITTRGAPWADLETYGCGWWIDTGVEPLVSALRSALALGDAERRAMGERGRAYVQRYDWDTIAAETLALYRWILGRGERPACVHLD